VSATEDYLHQWLYRHFGNERGKVVLASMTAADRLALARALVPEGYVVAKVPPEPEPRHQHHTVWCHGFNACRAAMIAAAQEEADAT